MNPESDSNWELEVYKSKLVASKEKSYSVYGMLQPPAHPFLFGWDDYATISISEYESTAALVISLWDCVGLFSSALSLTCLCSTSKGC